MQRKNLRCILCTLLRTSLTRLVIHNCITDDALLDIQELFQYDCINWIRNLKKEGKIKHYGFSFHDKAEVLDRFLTKYPDFEEVVRLPKYLLLRKSCSRIIILMHQLPAGHLDTLRVCLES